MTENALSRRAVISTVTAAVAALAGCSSSDNPTTTDTTGSSDSVNEYPPGVTADGIKDSDRLIESTRTALTENDYDIETYLATSPDNKVTQRYKSSLQEKRQLLKFDGPSATNTIYVESDTTYIKSTNDSGTSYSQRTTGRSIADRHTESEIVSMLGHSEALGGIVKNGRFTPAKGTEYNGREVVEFNFDGVDKSQLDSPVSDPSGNLLVTPDGIVFDAALSMQVSADSGPVTYENTFALNTLGSVRVARPPWVEDQF